MTASRIESATTVSLSSSRPPSFHCAISVILASPSCEAHTTPCAQMEACTSVTSSSATKIADFSERGNATIVYERVSVVTGPSVFTRSRKP